MLSKIFGKHLRERCSGLLQQHFPYRILTVNYKKTRNGIPDNLEDTMDSLFCMGSNYMCELEQVTKFIKEYKPELSEDKIMSDLKELLDLGYIYFE